MMERAESYMQQYVLLCSTRCGESSARWASTSVWPETAPFAFHRNTHFKSWFLRALTVIHDGYEHTCNTNTVVMRIWVLDWNLEKGKTKYHNHTSITWVLGRWCTQFFHKTQAELPFINKVSFGNGFAEKESERARERGRKIAWEDSLNSWSSNCKNACGVWVIN
jgi:hypothetical protein